GLSRSPGQVAHVLFTRAPVYSPSCPDFLPRLACLRHAASVRSEPGSNSPYKLSVTTVSRAATALETIGLTAISKKSDRLRTLPDPRRPIKGMHYYSVFKDQPLFGANGNDIAP